MKRLLIPAALFVTFTAVAVWADDQVTYQPPGAAKESEVRGTIEEETPGVIRIKTKMGVVEVPALQVRSVIYQSKKVTPLELRKPQGKELRALTYDPKQAAKRAEFLNEALAGYKEVDAQVKEEVNLHRYLQYKIAIVLTLLSRDDATKTDAAIAALTDFKTSFPTGWEIVPALKLLAQLLEEKGDTDGASKAYEDLAGTPDLPKEMRQEAEVLAVRFLLRGSKYPEAEKKIKSLQGTLPKDAPQRAFLDVCLVQSQIAQGRLGDAEPQLRSVLKTAVDPSLRAVANNLLGDYYRLKSDPEEAFWHYLRVDVLYPQDRDEHAKALYFLSQLFDKPKNDPARADECRKRLQAPEFNGTSYQRRVAEKK